MTAKDLIKYLSRYDPERRVGFLVVNLNERVVYGNGSYQLLDDPENGPVIILESNGETEPLDDVLEEVSS